MRFKILLLVMVLVLVIPSADAAIWTRGTTFFDGLYCQLTGCTMTGDLISGINNWSTTYVGIGTRSPGEKLEIQDLTANPNLLIKSGNFRPGLDFDANRTNSGQSLSGIHTKWDGTIVAQIHVLAGSDATNKDNAELVFGTASAGTVTNRMIIDEDGNVGIGTTSPTHTLNVEGDSNLSGVNLYLGNGAGDLSVRGISSQEHSAVILNYGATSGTYSNLDIGSTGGTNPNTISFINNFGTVMTLLGSQLGALAGNVGIGTTNPQAKLTVNSGDLHVLNLGQGAEVLVRVEGNESVTDGRYAMFLFANAGDTLTNIESRLDGVPNDAGVLAFGTQPTGGIIMERMRINSVGDVGIGTMAPTHTLNVEGDSNFTENTTFEKDVIIDGTLYGGSIIKVGDDMNFTTGTIYLSEFSTSSAGGSLVVRRSNADGALFGIQNDIAGANINSGAGYIWITDAGNYTVDAHSSLDLNNPNEVVHHLRGDIRNEIWRLNPDTNESSFRFQDGLNTDIFIINKTGFIQVGRSGNPMNITMFSPDNTEFTCGVDNSGSFSCS